MIDREMYKRSLLYLDVVCPAQDMIPRLPTKLMAARLLYRSRVPLNQAVNYWIRK